MSDKTMSIAELDKALEAELAQAIASVESEDKAEEAKVEEPEDQATEDETEEVIETETDEEPEDGEDDEVEDTPVVPKDGKKTPEQKQREALIKMRQANSEIKKKFHEVESTKQEYEALLNRLMKEAGYDNYGAFKDALSQQLTQKEMKEKGYTKEQFDEVDRLRKELAQRDAELKSRQTAEQQAQAMRFDGTVKEYAKRAGVTSKYVYDQLDSLGYDVNTLLAQPNPEILIKGLLADRLVAEKQKKRVDTEKLSPAPTKESDAIDIDALIKAEMEAYKARKGNS